MFEIPASELGWIVSLLVALGFVGLVAFLAYRMRK
jgi:hypothetical protein